MTMTTRTRRDPRLAAMSEADRAQTAIERFRNSASEDEMQATIEDLVRRKGGRVFHIRNSAKSPETADMPDLLIVCPPVVGVIELKSAKRAITPGQQQVLDLLDECTALVVGVIRPWQLDELLEALR